MQYQLRKYQQEGFDFWSARPRCCWWWDMGLGKTLSTLHTLSVHRDRLPALIVAPLRVARFVWPTEIEKFGFDFKWNLVWGKDKVGQLLEPADIKITNFDSLGVIERVCREKGRVPFKTIVVDESTAFKNPASLRWKRLRAIINRVPNRLLLTGTPLPNGLSDIWGQMALLGPNRLGDYREFLDKNFTFDPFDRPIARPGAGDRVAAIVKPVVLRKRVDLEIDVPPISEVTETVEMNEKGREAYAAAEMEETESYAPLRTIASGFRYENHWSGERRTIWFGQWKLDRLAEIVADTGENALVVFNFRAERHAIVEQFGCPFIDGESRPKDEAAAIEAWNRGELRILAVHARSVGHGLNLQAGGRRIVWVSLPDSGEVYAQLNARLWRSGQEKPVVVHKLVCADTIDFAIDGLIAKKLLTERSLMEAVREQRSVPSDRSA